MKNNFKLLILLLSLVLVSCTEKKKQVKTPEVNIVSTVSPADGLDLKLVGSLFQDGKVTDAASLEKELNKEGGINNLDLDGNGKTDFINVSENEGTSKVKSLDLTTGSDKETTHIATIEVEKGVNGEYNINMSGSEQLYGSNTNYRSSFTPSLSEMVFYSWLFSPSRSMYYHTPYYYGHYPRYYSPRVVVSRSVYSTRTTTQRTTVSKTVTKSNKTYTPKTKSKNVNKTSPKTRKSIANTKTANKSFKKQNSNNLKKGGFTKNSTSKSSSKPTTRTTSKSKATKPKRTSRPSRSRSSSRSRSRSSGRRSDVNYKTNVTELKNALSVVTKLEGVTYDWDTTVLKTNEDFISVVGTDIDESRQVGFIAQDVEKVAPLLVTTDEDGKRVNYDLTVAYLVGAIKEQQEIIRMQASEISKINKRLSVSEESINKITNK